MPAREAWCPWCKRWIYPVQHTGPGHFCPSCQGSLGLDVSGVYGRKPAPGAGQAVEDPDAPQRELAL
jgi:hypothetical protein